MVFVGNIAHRFGGKDEMERETTRCSNLKRFQFYYKRLEAQEIQ